jgi:hypothetical protein
MHFKPLDRPQQAASIQQYKPNTFINKKGKQEGFCNEIVLKRRE